MHYNIYSSVYNNETIIMSIRALYTAFLQGWRSSRTTFAKSTLTKTSGSGKLLTTSDTDQHPT